MKTIKILLVLSLCFFTACIILSLQTNSNKEEYTKIIPKNNDVISTEEYNKITDKEVRLGEHKFFTLYSDYVFTKDQIKIKKINTQTQNLEMIGQDSLEDKSMRTIIDYGYGKVFQLNHYKKFNTNNTQVTQNYAQDVVNVLTKNGYTLTKSHTDMIGQNYYTLEKDDYIITIRIDESEVRSSITTKTLQKEYNTLLASEEQKRAESVMKDIEKNL